MKIKLLLTFILSALVIVTVHLSTKNIYQDNKFLRNIQTKAAYLKHKLDLTYNSYYIAGLIGDTLYLGNSTAMLTMLKVPISLKEKKHVLLDTSIYKTFKANSLRLSVDSPFFHLIDVNTPIIFKGNIQSLLYQPIKVGNNSFSSLLMIGSNSFVATYINYQIQETFLQKIVSGKQSSVPKKNILEKQIDGVFCTDGQLQYDKKTGILVYTYLYRNQYICMDTNLTVIYKGNTIDTNSRAKIKIGEYSSDKNVKTLEASSLKVNKKSSISNEWLFINSALMANNDDPSNFENSSAIDVYNLADKEYKYSFYIATKTKGDLRDFKVYGNNMFVINDHFLEVYELGDHYFPNQKLPKH